MLSALSELLQLLTNQIIIFNQILKTLIANGDGKFWESQLLVRPLFYKKAVNNEAKGKTITGSEMFMLAYSFDQFM